MSTSPLRQPVPRPDRIDPITTSVIQGALENIAVEMGYKLMRMSYSSTAMFSSAPWMTEVVIGSMRS